MQATRAHREAKKVGERKQICSLCSSMWLSGERNGRCNYTLTITYKHLRERSLDSAFALLDRECCGKIPPMLLVSLRVRMRVQDGLRG